MDEEMEYAEMLEIPVSTVNVTKKRTKKTKKTQDLKEKALFNLYYMGLYFWELTPCR